MKVVEYFISSSAFSEITWNKQYDPVFTFVFIMMLLVFLTCFNNKCKTLIIKSSDNDIRYQYDIITFSIKITQKCHNELQRN